ncbi:hypothetical protein KJ973_02535 [Patescibacteria group bacterium]|nr:hypothetical protein [Patescibacteria group bacterium]MBU1519541.1 hypothetical protein [Patescibacteria group bacterium]MBU2416511.1 hypothetical protein [Patescibacteria group bacterium]MBU2460570.1 hypothetical protein [Patescibacteria group bacterium]
MENFESIKNKTNTETIVEGVLNKVESPTLFEDLKKMPGEKLQALLIALYNERAKDLKPKDILRQVRESRFLEPSEISLKEFNSFDDSAIEMLGDDVEAIELSPVGPLGSTSVLSRISQKNIITTSRNNEVLSDASPLLAIEYEKRRKEGVANSVHLFTSHRIIRAQNFDKIKGFTPHFRAMFLLSGDKFLRRWELIEGFLEKHINYYLSVIKNSVTSKDFRVNKVKVSVSNLMISENLISGLKLDRNLIMKNTQNADFSLFKDNNIEIPTRINAQENIDSEVLNKYGVKKAYEYLLRNCKPLIDSLKTKYPDVDFDLDLERIAGIGYYDNLCFKISAQNETSEWYPLADGGFTDWTQKLAQSDKEICLTSGFGTELFIGKFKK